MGSTLKYALLNSLGTAAYVALIASFIFLLGQSPLADKPDTILAPIAMLMLFVFSAAFTGFLVFGRPIMWYLDGKKKEAVGLLFYTPGIFLLILLIVFFVILVTI